jgi:hypothetical protein
MSALEDDRVVDEIGRQELDDRLVLDARKGRRLRHPRAESSPAAVGERVVRPLARLPRLLARREIPEPLEPLRLGVEVALRAAPVDPPLAHHPDEVVRTGAALADERQDGVREGSQFIP